jgi:type I restriction enzyme, S subunit
VRRHVRTIPDAPDAAPSIQVADVLLALDDEDSPLRVRRLIYSLAVRGRLVEQRGSDRVDKGADVTSSVAREEPNPSAMGMGAVVLPVGWRWARFPEVASIESDLVDPKTCPNAPHIAPDCIEKGTGRLLAYRTVREDGVTSVKHRFRAGQLLYSKIRPNLSKLALVDFDGVCSADMYPLSVRIEPRYLATFMLSDLFLRQVVRNDNRIAMPKVNQQQLSSTLVALPPLLEQRRIVSSVDELMRLWGDLCRARAKVRLTGDRLECSALEALIGAESDQECVSAWGRIAERFDAITTNRRALERLRRAILELAVRGRLVRQPTEAGAAAHEMATVIRPQRVALGRVGRGGRGRRSEAVDLVEPYLLPDGWMWCRLADIAGHIVDGTHHTPRYVKRGMDFISAKDIERGTIHFEGCRQIGAEEFGELSKRCLPKRGDVLVQKSGSIGGVAVVETDRPFTLFESVALIPVVPAVNPYYVAHVVHLGATGEFGNKKQKGVGVTHLHLVDLRELPVPLPPRRVQDAIVVRINELIALLDSLATGLDAREVAARVLGQTLVAEATR